MRRRIAIVEDDPVIRANYADVLKKSGYEVAAYGDRGEALAALRLRLPDLALLDIGLGDEVDGGFTLCRELRTLSATLPIIFLTARDGECFTMIPVRDHIVAVLFQHVGVVGADNGVVFNDGNASAHAESRAGATCNDYTRWKGARKGGGTTAIFLPQFIGGLTALRPPCSSFRASNASVAAFLRRRKGSHAIAAQSHGVPRSPRRA